MDRTTSSKKKGAEATQVPPVEKTLENVMIEKSCVENPFDNWDPFTHGKLPPQLEAAWDSAVEKDVNEHGDEEHSHDYYIEMLKTVGNKQEVNQESMQAAFEQRKKIFEETMQMRKQTSGAKKEENQDPMETTAALRRKNYEETMEKRQASDDSN